MNKSPLKRGYTRGLLTVMKRAAGPNGDGHTRWTVRCKCGLKFDLWGHSLTKKTGGSYSCGKGECRRAGAALRKQEEEVSQSESG